MANRWNDPEDRQDEFTTDDIDDRLSEPTCDDTDCPCRDIGFRFNEEENDRESYKEALMDHNADESMDGDHHSALESVYGPIDGMEPDGE